MATVATVAPALAAGAVAPSADLSVSVAHSPDTPVTSDALTVTVTATNDGPDTAAGVVIGVSLQYPLQLSSTPAGCTVSSAVPSLLCPVGDLASGASTTVEVHFTAYASGLVTVPVAVASSTADPDAADRSTTDTILVQRGPSQAERYLTAIYPIILDRPVDPSSLDYWGRRWRQARFFYPYEPIVVPLGIIRSAEYRRLRVREAYPRILGRSVDPAGLAYWVAKLGTGFTYEQFERTLMTSGEFERKHPGDDAYVAAVHAAIFSSAPDAAELAAAQALFDASSTRARFVRRMQTTTEAYDVQIAHAYQLAFGEAPNSWGRYAWQVDLRRGATFETMLASLLVSPTFLADFPLSADDYDDPIPVPVPVADGQQALVAAVEAAATS